MEKDSLFPQPPWVGPPLPKILGQKWPWVSEPQPTDAGTANSDPPQYRIIPLKDSDIIELHKEGMSSIDIAARLDANPYTIKYRLRRAGYEPIVATRFLKAAERSADIIRLHQEGLTTKQIAERLGLSIDVICRRLREAELAPHPSAEEAEVTVKALNEIINLGKRDVPRYEIAKRTGSTWPLVAQALEGSSVKPIIPACGEIASWASTLLPTIDEIREAHPDTEPILRKIDQLEKELVAIGNATWTAEDRLPWRGKKADEERYCLGDIKRSTSESLEFMDALKGCIKDLDVEKLPKKLEQARICIKNTANIMSGAMCQAAERPEKV